MECKLITSKNYIGTYFGHMVTISDLGADPKAGPCHLFNHLIDLSSLCIINKNFMTGLEEFEKIGS